MKNRSTISWLLASTLLLSLQITVSAQTNNSWTNAAGGNWEDPYWSLGILPGTNQTILFTNSGWKALAIGPGTAQNFPETLTVGSITISAPTNSFNTLLLNYAGLQTALTANSLAINTDSAVAMFSSSLLVKSNISVGGAFTESDASQVGAGSLQLGSLGSGTYNLTNSALSAGTEYVGPGTFNQQGGTNATDLTLQGAGGYELFDGVFNGAIELDGGNFDQWDGNVSGSINFVQGSYHLAAGQLSPVGGLQIPAILPDATASGSFLQTGGTNLTSGLELGSAQCGTGSYVLSNGVLVASNGIGFLYYTAIQYFTGGYTAESYGSSFVQSGGVCTNGGIYVNPPFVAYPQSLAGYELDDGILSTPSIILNTGVFSQRGGANVAGNISINGPQSYYSMNDGSLTAQSVQLTRGATFYHLGGILNLSGILNLVNGLWYEQTGGQQFGQLQLGNSTLLLATNNCILHFADSSSLVWSNNASLQIQNWSGSLYGGGYQQIIFGGNTAALTPQQVSRIQFQNPAGLAPGTYPARILATGEIVPDTGAPLPLKLQINCSLSNGTMPLQVQGDIGNNYEVDVSTDLMNWTLWTSQSNSIGTISISDPDATNFPQRFYRVRLIP